MIPPQAFMANIALAQKVFELGLATPQVMAHRITRMLGTGPNISTRDRKEFMLMHTEKVGASYQCWMAMWLQGVRAQSRFMASLFMTPPVSTAAATKRFNRQLSSNLAGVTDVVNAGLKPLHAKAVSNSRRLSRKRK